MYNLPYFKENDERVVLEFIHMHPFAFITGCDENNKPVATQTPVFIEGREGRLFLSAHMMKQTDHLSQNKDKESYHHIIDKLKQQDGDGKMIAGEMEKRKDQLFRPE